MIRPIPADFEPGDPAAPWAAVAPLKVDHYLWLDNGYRPAVEARLCWSSRFLYVRFEVAEKRVRVTYTNFQDPVYEDSCVEFFVDAFPGTQLGYMNFETNAAGTLLAAFGPDRFQRTPFSADDMAGFEAVPSIRRPIDGEYGEGPWTLAYRIPLTLFSKTYGRESRSGHRARANFYKCGDATETPHFGAWRRVETPAPDFHRPEFFGEIVFG